MAFTKTLVALMMITGLARSATVPALFMFGDSLVDVGNNNLLQTQVKANFAPYGCNFNQTKTATGRFSDGQLIHDFIASYLGLTSPPPFLATQDFNQGVNFASAGSGLFSWEHGVFSLMQQVINFELVRSRLIEQHGATNASSLISSSIFYICTGNTDVDNVLHSRALGLPFRFRMALLLELGNQIQRLYRLDARKFVVVGLNAVGCTPKNQQFGRCSWNGARASVYYNNGLSVLLSDLRHALSNVHIVMADLESVVFEAKRHPSFYGFSNTIQGCCPANNPWISCYQGATTCTNVSEYVFWDMNNPTQAFNEIVSRLWWNGSRDYIAPMNILQLASL